MKKNLFLLLTYLMLPWLSFSQMFGDLGKNSKDVDSENQAKGLHIVFSFSPIASISGQKALEYEKQTSFGTKKQSTVTSRVGNASILAELGIGYRIKEFDFGIGINHIGYSTKHMFAEPFSSTIDIDEKVTVTSLFLNASYVYKVNKRMEFSFGILGGYPFYSSSNLSDKVSSQYLIGTNILAILNLNKKVGLQLGIMSRHVNHINSTFDFSNPQSKNGTEFYDFSINKNRTQMLNFVGLSAGIIINLSKK